MARNDQVVRTIPGTDIGGHDTHGTDGKVRDERPGEILGTPNPDSSTKRETASDRAREAARADYVTREVDRANREELPKLGGRVDDTWQPDKGKNAPAAKAAPKAAAPVAAPKAAPKATAAPTGISVKPGVDR